LSSFTRLRRTCALLQALWARSFESPRWLSPACALPYLSVGAGITPPGSLLTGALRSTHSLAGCRSLRITGRLPRPPLSVSRCCRPEPASCDTPALPGSRPSLSIAACGRSEYRAGSALDVLRTSWAHLTACLRSPRHRFRGVVSRAVAVMVALRAERASTLDSDLLSLCRDNKSEFEF
jgi:hypothetical protein